MLIILKELVQEPQFILLQSLNIQLLKFSNLPVMLLKIIKKQELSQDTFFQPLETTNNQTSFYQTQPLLKEESYQTSAVQFTTENNPVENQAKPYDFFVIFNFSLPFININIINFPTNISLFIPEFSHQNLSDNFSFLIQFKFMFYFKLNKLEILQSLQINKQTKYILKMPKIKSVPGQIEQSFDGQYSSTRRFPRVDNNPQLRNAQYLTPIVPIHQVPYNPQFSKSPLASVQMSRKPHLRIADQVPKNIQYNNYDNDYHVEQGQDSKCDWKKILCWALIALAIIGLAIGLYFLIDSILSKKRAGSLQQSPNLNYNLPAKNQYYTGVNPIYVNPIPYNSIYNPSVSTPVFNDPTTYPSVSSSYPTVSSAPSNTNLPPVTYPTSTNPQSTINSSLNPPSTSTTATTVPKVVWNSNPSQNSVSPIDVYAGNHE